MTRTLVLLALIACKRDGNGTFGSLPDAKVTYLSQGDGPENAAPLEPARAGFRSTGPSVWQRWAGDLDAGRDDVSLKDVSGMNNTFSPYLRAGVGLYRRTDDGLVLHALDVPLDDTTRPVLMVPDTVRLGMEWESEFGDGDVNHMAVVAHETLTLPIGPADIWAIAEYGDPNSASWGTHVRWYAEGIGRVGTSLNATTWLPEYGYTELVSPAEDQAHVERGLDPVALESVLAIDPHGETGHEVFGLSGMVTDGRLWAYMDGLDPAIGYSRAIAHDYCGRMDAAPAWDSSGCYTHTVLVEDPLGYGATEQSEMMNAAMILPGVGFAGTLNSDGGVSDKMLTSWVVDGVAHSLQYEQWGNPPSRFFHYQWDTDNPLPTDVADGVSTRTLFLTGLQDSPTGAAGSSMLGQIWLGPAVVDAGAPLYFAIVTSEGQVFRAALIDDALTGFTPVGVLPGTMSILLDGDERRATSITTDGRVFGLRVDQTDGAVSITSLGAVRVEEPGGAYEFKGVLLDPTHPGDAYVAAIATSATSVPFYPTGLFKARLDADPTPVVTAASLMVGAAETDAGLAVCWAPSDEPFESDGWTLRGEPVRVTGPVGPDGNCALLDFDPVAPSDPAWVGSERAIAATVPGVGDVRLGFPAGRHAGHSPATDAAVLRDGRVVDTHGLVLASDGFPTSRTPPLVPILPGGYPHDLGGYGMWTWPNGTSPTTEIVNVGGGIPKPPCPSTEPWEICSWGGPVVGGGMLMLVPTTPYTIQVIKPDGTLEDLPAEQTAVAPSGGILLADGRYCGLAGFPREITCADSSGARQTTGPVLGSIQPRIDAYWPLSDGSLLIGNDPSYGPSYRFDPATMTATELDPRGLRSAITSADGKVYAIAQAVDGTTEVVLVTPTGATNVPGGAGATAVIPIDGALLVNKGGWVRVPR